MYYSLYNMWEFVTFVEPKIYNVSYWEFNWFVAFNIGYLENFVSFFFFENLKYKFCMFKNKELRVPKSTFQVFYKPYNWISAKF
jgi:hypothetical protein